MDFVNKIEYAQFLADGGLIQSVVDAARAGKRLPPGQYAFAIAHSDEIILGRDPIGCNKLFFGFTQQGVLIVANRIATVWQAGVTLRSIVSCPPGEVIAVRPDGIHKIGGGNAISSATVSDHFDLEAFQSAVNGTLEKTFKQIACNFANCRVVVCLSGGLDSALVASYAARHLPGVTAASFTYLDDSDLGTFSSENSPEEWNSASEDFRGATKIAYSLGLPLLPVIRPRTAVAATVKPAILLGQDWRDFNVHCATVNLFLAQDIRAAFPGEKVLVLTGDLMNEFVCDYREEVVNGQRYYKIPSIPIGRRRKYFVLGLDAGDREIGVMSAYGLVVCQPFAALVDHYLSIPPSFLDHPNAKAFLNRPLLSCEVASHVSQSKTRAQVGGQDLGTLGLYHRMGITDTTLKDIWLHSFTGETNASCEGLIEFGRYRSPVYSEKKS